MLPFIKLADWSQNRETGKLKSTPNVLHIQYQSYGHMYTGDQIWGYTHAHMYTHIWAHIDTQPRRQMDRHRHRHRHTNIDRHIHIHRDIHNSNTNQHKHVHTYIHIYTYTHNEHEYTQLSIHFCIIYNSSRWNKRIMWSFFKVIHETYPGHVCSRSILFLIIVIILQYYVILVHFICH